MYFDDQLIPFEIISSKLSNFGQTIKIYLNYSELILFFKINKLAITFVYSYS